MRPLPADGLTMTSGRGAAPGSGVCMSGTLPDGRASARGRPRVCRPAGPDHRQGIAAPCQREARWPTTAPDHAESARSQEKEVARIAAFSDGVFAIAITLLALQLEIPSGDSVDVWPAIQDLWPNLLSFAISFAVIGAYWVAHHRLYSVIDRYDARLLWLNLLSLFFIVIMPFTTALVGEHGDQDASVIVYALTVAMAGFANTGMALYALGGRRLCAEHRRREPDQASHLARPRHRARLQLLAGAAPSGSDGGVALVALADRVPADRASPLRAFRPGVSRPDIAGCVLVRADADGGGR